MSRAAAKHTTVAKRKGTTGVMGDGSDLGVSGGTGTVGRGPWEDLRASLLGCRRCGGVLPAALEAVAVAVHLQDVGRGG